MKPLEVVVEKLYRKAAVERAMKVQEVIMRAMAKQITWWQAPDLSFQMVLTQKGNNLRSTARTDWFDLLTLRPSGRS